MWGPTAEEKSLHRSAGRRKALPTAAAVEEFVVRSHAWTQCDFLFELAEEEDVVPALPTRGPTGPDAGG